MTCLERSIEQDLVTVCYLDTEVPGTPRYA